MGLFSKLFKGPKPDMEKSAVNAKKVLPCLTRRWSTARYRLIVGIPRTLSGSTMALFMGAKLKSAI
ncbi:MAG: hypothetical protein ACLT5P_13895 [Flavonifractor plautii]